MRRAYNVDPRTRAQLEEAIREVHIIAGLGSDEDGRTSTARSISIGVTSPDYGDGKTTISIALAASLSEDFGTEVTLVDADFHTHSVERQYGLEGRSGLAEVLAGTTQLPSVAQPVGSGAMLVVPAGATISDPARLARSGFLGPAVKEMKQMSSHVVLDLPATLHSMNTPALAQRCDAVIVVVRNGHTTRQELDRTLHLLRDAHVIGVVVNRYRSSVPGWVQRTLGMRA